MYVVDAIRLLTCFLSWSRARCQLAIAAADMFNIDLWRKDERVQLCDHISDAYMGAPGTTKKIDLLLSTYRAESPLIWCRCPSSTFYSWLQPTVLFVRCWYRSQLAIPGIYTTMEKEHTRYMYAVDAILLLTCILSRSRAPCQLAIAAADILDVDLWRKDERVQLCDPVSDAYMRASSTTKEIDLLLVPTDLVPTELNHL